tara:strand:+ start:248 stop:496 length:249 start_codon:yes stop_codon:yes gene_type:complete
MNKKRMTKGTPVRLTVTANFCHNIINSKGYSIRQRAKGEILTYLGKQIPGLEDHWSNYYVFLCENGSNCAIEKGNRHYLEVI